jgi:hypothetical protein
MKLFRLVPRLLFGALVVAGAALADGSNDDHGDCRAVRARGVGQDLGGGRTTATITRGGILNGTTAAMFGITGGTPPVLTFAGTVVFTTKRGTLTIGIAGTFNVATGAFDASGPVSGGTGRFAGASGMLRLMGVQDLSTGRFTETIRGTLCLADGDDDDDDDN